MDALGGMEEVGRRTGAGKRRCDLRAMCPFAHPCDHYPSQTGEEPGGKPARSPRIASAASSAAMACASIVSVRRAEAKRCVASACGALGGCMRTMLARNRIQRRPPGKIHEPSAGAVGWRRMTPEQWPELIRAGLPEGRYSGRIGRQHAFRGAFVAPGVAGLQALRATSSSIGPWDSRWGVRFTRSRSMRTVSAGVAARTSS